MAHEADVDLARFGLVERHGVFVDEGIEVGVVAGEFGVIAGWLDVAWDGPATPAAQLRDVVHIPFPRVDLVAQALATLRAKETRPL